MVSAPPGPVVDHDLLAELLAELGAEDARDRIGRAARRLRHDQPDRLVGKFGRRRKTRTSRQAAAQRRRSRRMRFLPFCGSLASLRAIRKSGGFAAARGAISVATHGGDHELPHHRPAGRKLLAPVLARRRRAGRARRGAPHRPAWRALPRQPDRRDAGRRGDPGRTTSTTRSTAPIACALRSMCARASRPTTRSTRCREQLRKRTLAARAFDEDGMMVGLRAGRGHEARRRDRAPVRRAARRLSAPALRGARLLCGARGTGLRVGSAMARDRDTILRA